MLVNRKYTQIVKENDLMDKLKELAGAIGGDSSKLKRDLEKKTR